MMNIGTDIEFLYRHIARKNWTLMITENGGGAMETDETAFQAYYGSFIKDLLCEDFCTNYSGWPNTKLEQERV
jgi:hypothetical protein